MLHQARIEDNFRKFVASCYPNVLTVANVQKILRVGRCEICRTAVSFPDSYKVLGLLWRSVEFQENRVVIEHKVLEEKMDCVYIVKKVST